MEALHALVEVVTDVLGVAGGDLTVSQLRALAALAGSGPLRSVDLAATLSLSPSAVSRLCARLDERGLVSLRRSATSRREVRIQLTASGWRLLDDVVAGGLRRIGGAGEALGRAAAVGGGADATPRRA